MKTCLPLMLLALAHSIDAQTFTFDFSDGLDGWSADFADYPTTDSLFYQLQWALARLPVPLDTNQYAIRISGNNHSDDLFMFVKRAISGLTPHTTYALTFEVELASDVATNLVGVGGAPGEGVTVKAGATLVEPVKVDSSGFYIMNIDKGNQSQRGEDMDTIGHVGVTDTTTRFTLIERNNLGRPFYISTDASGVVWFIAGTDSGFEANTTLYYNKVTLTFETTTPVLERPVPTILTLYPNPASTHLRISTISHNLDQSYLIFNTLGQLVQVGIMTAESTIDVSNLPAGVLTLRSSSAIGRFVKQ